MPIILHNPETADLVSHLAGASKVTSDTELLFYFVGHSVSSGEDDIRLILGLNQEKLERYCLLSWLLETIFSQTPIRKLVMILDTCHAGRTLQKFRPLKENAFAMFGTGDTYALDANFSDGLLRALERPIHKNDQRIDRRAGGMTYNKVFEEATRRVISGSVESDSEQEPKSFGDYGGTLVLEAPVSVPDEFNKFASNRTVYGRTFRLLEIIRDTNLTFDELHGAVWRDPVFLLRRHPDGDGQYLSPERLNEYLDFLRKTNWVVQPKGRYELTKSGQEATNRKNFNRTLRDAIEEKIFPDGVTFEFLDAARP